MASAELAELESNHPELEQLDEDMPATREMPSLLSRDDIPAPPKYFKLGTLQSVDEERKEIRIKIEGSTVPTVQCGDGCKVNEKGAYLTEETLGIPSPKSRCMSHIAHG